MSMPVPRLFLTNDSRKVGEDEWEWSIWLEGPDDDVARVRSVTYRLHPTFPKPVVEVKDAASRFRLTGRGWGEFMVVAEARLEEGARVRLERWLELAPEAKTRAATPESKAEHTLSVYIAASLVDEPMVDDLTKALLTRGVRVLRPEPDIGTSNHNMTARTIDRADGMVAIISDDKSHWVQSELAHALKANKPVVPVLVGSVRTPAPIERLPRLAVSGRESIEGLANSIAARLKDACLPEEG